MRELSYNEIINIQDNISRKLISYINDYLDNDESIESIEFHYPDFDEDKTSKAFDSWLSMDYKTEDKKTFITHILEDKSYSLSFLERDMLKEIEKSYISLYEIINIKNDHIQVFDLLMNKKYKLWDPKSVNIIKKGDIIFGRVGKVIEHKSFIGTLSFLPPTVKEDFIEEIKQDYSKTTMMNEYMTLKDYLKNYSLHLYEIYTDLVYDLIKKDEEFASKIYDELDDFEGYMENYLSTLEIQEYIGNLMNFFEYYLIENGLDLKDIYNLDFRILTKKAIEEGFINSKEDFISYLDTFKNYTKYLKCKDRKYKDTHNEIIEISQDRFLYFDILDKAETPFKINRKLSKGIYRKLSEKAFSTLMDYERFILYILGTPLNLDINNNIRKDDLIEINYIMDNRIDESKENSDYNFSMLNLFYKFSLDKETLKINNGFLKVTKKGNQFLRLKDEDKFAIIFNYIWSNKFLMHIARKHEFSDNDKMLFLSLLEGLKENEQHRLEKIVYTFEKFPNILDTHYKYLEIIGVVERKESKNMPISITPFGKLVLSLSYKEDNIKKIGKIINLNIYKKTR